MKKSAFKWVILAFILFVLFYLNQAVLDVTPIKVRVWIISFGLFAPFLYVLLYLIRPLFLFPSSILFLASGLAFGAFWGSVYTVVGATLSAVVAFVVAKRVGHVLLREELESPRVQAIQQQLEENGFFYVLLLRLIPFLNFDLVSYAAGVSNIRLGHFTLATLIGVIPGICAYNILGSSLVSGHYGLFWISLFLLFALGVSPLFLSPRLRAKLGINKLKKKDDS